MERETEEYGRWKMEEGRMGGTSIPHKKRYRTSGTHL
jgi:hypothetical protein